MLAERLSQLGQTRWGNDQHPQDGQTPPVAQDFDVFQIMDSFQMFHPRLPVKINLTIKEVYHDMWIAGEALLDCRAREYPLHSSLISPENLSIFYPHYP